MAENKTKSTTNSVEDFLNAIPDPVQRQDSAALTDLMRQATGLAPKMWGSAMVGFGDRHYRYESGREGDTFLVGFSPRKQALTLYVGLGSGIYEDLLGKLGKYKTGKGCLYIDRLADVDLPTLKELVARSAVRSAEG
jgi:hypothetical protein